MNNEEKILSMLETLVTKVDKLEYGQTQMQTDISNLKQSHAKLEQGQVRLEGKVDKLEQGQAEIKHKLDIVYEQTANLTEFRTETHQKLSDLFDDIKDLKTVTKENTYDIAGLKATR